MHFEEILFDNTGNLDDKKILWHILKIFLYFLAESSSFFQTDNSDSESKSKDAPCVESILGTESKKSGNEQRTEENEQTASTLSRQSSREKEHNDELKLKIKMLQIEEEKLEIERQKLQVMKHISRDLSSISKTLIEVLQNTRK